MRSQRIIAPHRRMARNAAWLLVLLILIAAAVNVPWAISLMHTPPINLKLVSQPRPMQPRAWPAATPHRTSWTAPDSWDEEYAFGYRHFNVISSATEPEGNGFQMELTQLGWPLPVLEDKQLWWNWNDPKLKGPERDPPMSLKWPGLILNPLILGGSAWLALVVPTVGPIILRRWHRHRKHQCLACGYPVGESPVCTECGDTLNP